MLAGLQLVGDVRVDPCRDRLGVRPLGISERVRLDVAEALWCASGAIFRPRIEVRIAPREMQQACIPDDLLENRRRHQSGTVAGFAHLLDEVQLLRAFAGKQTQRGDLNDLRIL